MKGKLQFVLGFAALLTTASTVHAQFVTNSASITGPVSVIDFSEFVPNGVIVPTADPNAWTQVGNPVGRDVRMSYMSGSYGLYAGAYGWGLSPSDSWNRPSVGINQFGVVRYSFFGGPVSGVGVLMNYAGCCTGQSVFVRTLDEYGNVIDEVNLLSNGSIPTQAYNQGEFRGFQYNTASVYHFEVGDIGGSSSPIMTDLTFSEVTTVPEPSAVVLMGAGLLALAGVAGKRRQKV